MTIRALLKQAAAEGATPKVIFAALLNVATQQRYLRQAAYEGPTADRPPAGASKDGAKRWKAVVDKYSKAIFADPGDKGRQWATAVAIWQKSCKKHGVQPYGSTSTKTHGIPEVHKAVKALHGAMQQEGYKKNHPAHKHLTQLMSQLKADGYPIEE